MRNATLFLAAAALFGGAAPLAAQSAGATLRLDVQASAELLPDHTVRVSYQVQNLASSTSPLWIFAVQTPVAPASVETPAPAENFLVTDQDFSGSVASWAWVDGFPAPGETSPALRYTARGLPGLVRYRATRYVEPPVVSDDELAEPEQDPSFDTPDEDAVFGTTLGIVALPESAPVDELAASLRGLVEESCSRGWIQGRGICQSLLAKARPEAGPLGAFVNELEAQRGNHVSETAFALLAAHAQYLASRLGS